MRARNALYSAGYLRQERLSRPVISIGNLSVGGSGKTPIVESIARLLMAEGERPAIVVSLDEVASVDHRGFVADEIVRRLACDARVQVSAKTSRTIAFGEE